MGRDFGKKKGNDEEAGFGGRGAHNTEKKSLRKVHDDEGAKGGKGGKGDRSKETLAKVQSRMANPLWAVKWHDFCEREANGEHDPSQHTVFSLKRALNLLPWAGGGVNGDRRMKDEQRLVDFIQTRLHDPPYRTRWADFCFAYGNGNLDPQLLSYTFLRAANKCLSFDLATSRFHQQLVEKVWGFLNNSPVWRAHWQRFCEQNSDGNSDPQAHEPFFLKNAMEELGRWEKENQRRVALAELINNRQKTDAAFRVRWVGYCKQFNKATFVPKELRPEAPGKGLSRDALFFKSSFLDLAFRDLSAPDEVHRVGLRNAASTDALVAEVNSHLADPQWKAAWTDYCTKNSDGSEDPSLQDAAFLRRALRELGKDADKDTAARSHEIQVLCDRRMKALNNKDYAQAGTLKTTLWGIGVELYDSTKTWRSDDGLSGSFRDPYEVNLSRPEGGRGKGKGYHRGH